MLANAHLNLLDMFVQDPSTAMHDQINVHVCKIAMALYLYKHTCKKLVADLTIRSVYSREYHKLDNSAQKLLKLSRVILTMKKSSCPAPPILEVLLQIHSISYP